MPSQKFTRSAVKRRKRNSSIRSATRSSVANATNQIVRGQIGEAEIAVTSALSALDGASKKGVIHDNNAARRKPHLMAKLNALKNKS